MDKKYYISSTKHSIRERQTKKHGKVYDLYFRVIQEDGKEKQIKKSGFSNKTLANQYYLDFISKCERVKNIAIKREKKAQEGKEIITIGDLSKTYLLAIRNQIKDSSVYDAQNILNLFVLPKYKDKQLKDLTKQELTIWQDELWSKTNPRTNNYYSYKYLIKIRTVFSVFLTWCSERHNCINYFNEIKKPKKRISNVEMQIWTREDFEQFISVVDDITYKTFFSVLFFTGRRKGEVFALTHDDVSKDYIKFNKSLTRKTIDGAPYKITSTKAEKSAVSPICKPLQAILKEYKAPKGKFFFGGESPIAENTLTRAFNKYCELANVKRIRLHDLRHSFVSLLCSLNAPLTIVASLISDKLEQVTKTYAHFYEGDGEKIIAKII